MSTPDWINAEFFAFLIHRRLIQDIETFDSQINQATGLPEKWFNWSSEITGGYKFHRSLVVDSFEEQSITAWLKGCEAFGLTPVLFLPFGFNVLRLSHVANLRFEFVSPTLDGTWLDTGRALADVATPDGVVLDDWHAVRHGLNRDISEEHLIFESKETDNLSDSSFWEDYAIGFSKWYFNNSIATNTPTDAIEMFTWCSDWSYWTEQYTPPRINAEYRQGSIKVDVPEIPYLTIDIAKFSQCADDLTSVKPDEKTLSGLLLNPVSILLISSYLTLIQRHIQGNPAYQHNSAIALASTPDLAEARTDKPTNPTYWQFRNDDCKSVALPANQLHSMYVSVRLKSTVRDSDRVSAEIIIRFPEYWIGKECKVIVHINETSISNTTIVPDELRSKFDISVEQNPKARHPLNFVEFFLSDFEGIVLLCPLS
jgi:hypothetical protein